MLSELKQRFPYQFEGENTGIRIARGWDSLFMKLCADIDAITSDDPRGLHYGFHWSQVKEKFGTARLHWEISGPRERCNALVQAAQSQMGQICIICGTAPANIDDTGRYLLNLCELHAQQRKADPQSLESPWPLD
jgi:hypothetical protein